MNAEIKHQEFKTSVKLKSSYESDYPRSTYSDEQSYPYHYYEYKDYSYDDVPKVNPHRKDNIIFSLSIVAFLIFTLVLVLMFGWDGLQVPMILLGFAFVGGLVQAISDGQGG